MGIGGTSVGATAFVDTVYCVVGDDIRSRGLRISESLLLFKNMIRYKLKRYGMSEEIEVIEVCLLCMTRPVMR